MNSTNKLRLIFSYYITPNNEITYMHRLHMHLLQKYVNVFSIIDIYLCIDDIHNIDLIEKHKSFIQETLNCEINFFIEQNDQYYREGNIYINYVINKLDEYAKTDDLIFFAHTKGLTNEKNLNNLENTKQWVSLMYYMNLMK